MRLVVVRDVLSWFVMFRGGSSWFVMFCHGSSWFVMFHCHGFVMVRHGSLSWFIMVHHGSLSWFHHGSSWFTVMVHCHGSSWFTVMVRHGSSWFTVMVSSWFMMCYSLKFSRRRSCDPLFSQSGSQIHYQISFLMRPFLFSPFHLKSIPLKSSAKNVCVRTQLVCYSMMAIINFPHIHRLVMLFKEFWVC